MITIGQHKDNILQEYRNKTVDELLDVFFQDEPQSVEMMLAAQVINEKHEKAIEQSKFYLKNILFLGSIFVFIGFVISFVILNGIFCVLCGAK